MTNAQLVDQFALAHALLVAGTTTFAEARDFEHRLVHAESDEAVKFCLMGAMLRAAFELDLPLGPPGVIAWGRLNPEAGGLLARTFEANYDRSYRLLTHWFDQQATLPQALALLEECAGAVNPK